MITLTLDADQVGQTTITLTAAQLASIAAQQSAPQPHPQQPPTNAVPTPTGFRFANPATYLQRNFNYLAATATMNAAWNFLLAWGGSSGRTGTTEFLAEWSRLHGDPVTASQLINNFNNQGHYDLGVGGPVWGCRVVGSTFILGKVAQYPLVP